MEKLIIKELAPYLPFKLQWKFEGSDEVHEVMGIDITDFGVHLFSPFGDYGKCRINEGKPILRPLSSLTEEIKWGNQTYAITDLFEIGDEGGYIYEYDHGNIKLISQLKTIAEYNYHHDINYLPYPVVQVLIEHHFDVFGLIDRGLALPIDGKEVEGE